MANAKSPLKIDECLQVKRDIGMAHCGIVFAQYNTRRKHAQGPITPAERDQIKVGLHTAKNVMIRLTERLPDAKLALKPEIRKAKAAISKAKRIADELPKRIGKAGHEKLATAVEDALSANRAMDSAADRICRKGRS